MSWHQSVERLNRTAATELADALRQRDDLVGVARRLARFTSAVASGDPAGDGACAPRCVFHRVPDGAALCALVRALDGIEVATDAGLQPFEDVERLVQRFLVALSASMDAVRYCRLTEHPSGRCWFTLDNGDPACGEVLRLAHRLGQ